MQSLREARAQKGWTQAELSLRSGVPRSSIAAIENGALSPSVYAALALARALGVTVERLFGEGKDSDVAWAWSPTGDSPAYWEAAFGEKILAFPVEPLSYDLLPPDGWLDGGARRTTTSDAARMTFAIASCDPAAGLLAALLHEKAGVRTLTFQRSSRESLALLQRGAVHAAGIHLGEVGEAGGNAAEVRRMLGKGFRLLRCAVWDDGVAVRPGEGWTSFKSLRRARVRWVRREPGSGARRCEDKVRGRHSSAKDPVARNHREAALAVRGGWADAGVCHRLVAEQAGLDFLHVSRETFDICYPAEMERDPRIAALRKVVRGTPYREGLARFRGMDSHTTGEEETV